MITSRPVFIWPSTCTTIRSRKPIEHEDLLGLRQAELPRRTAVFDRGQRRRARSAVVTGDQHDIRMGFRDAGGDRPDADLRHELDVHARARVGVLEVVDQLREILNRVDVVVRRRRNQRDAGSGMPHLGDPRIHLVSRQLTAFAGLGALSHLDLQVVGVDEVLARHAKPARGDLLHGAAPPVAVGVPRVTARRPRPLPRYSTFRPAGSWRSPASRALPG